MSSSCTALRDIDTSDCHQLHEYLDRCREDLGAAVLYGGYEEQRSIYDRSDIFSHTTRRRNVHMGLDVWVTSGTSVVAIADGTIYGHGINHGLGNYGPTIVIKHRCTVRGEFYALYGHLDDIYRGKVGDAVQVGQHIAHIGTPAVNGDYPPHLHLQIIINMEGNYYDYPGVYTREDVPKIRKNCPDPMTYLSY